MGVQLNIKGAETVRLARELAEARGQPVTQAIKQALEMELERRAVELEAFLARVREISRGFRARMPEDWHGKTSREIMDEMYEDDEAILLGEAEQRDIARTLGNSPTRRISAGNWTPACSRIWAHC